MQIRRVGSAVLVVALISGLAYSVVGLTFAPKVAYASSCDCSEGFIDAEEYCFANYGNEAVLDFQCPIGPSGGPYATFFMCAVDGSRHGQACPD
jgi:hypothetical protein